MNLLLLARSRIGARHRRRLFGGQGPAHMGIPVYSNCIKNSSIAYACEDHFCSGLEAAEDGNFVEVYEDRPVGACQVEAVA